MNQTIALIKVSINDNLSVMVGIILHLIWWVFLLTFYSHRAVLNIEVFDYNKNISPIYDRIP